MTVHVHVHNMLMYMYVNALIIVAIADVKHRTYASTATEHGTHLLLLLPDLSSHDLEEVLVVDASIDRHARLTQHQHHVLVAHLATKLRVRPGKCSRALGKGCVQKVFLYRIQVACTYCIQV